MNPIRKFFRMVYRNRSVSLSPEGTRFVLLTFAVGLAAVNTGNNLLYLLLAMMLSLIVLSGVLSEQCIKHLMIHRRIPEHIFANQPATAYFSLTNRKARIPSFSLRLVDVIDEQPVDRGIHVLHLGPGSSTIQPFPLLIPHRGLYRIQGVKVLTRFPFSLFVKGRTFSHESETVIYPAITPLPGRVYQELETRGQDNPVSKRGQGGDLYNLRMYQPGDDSRSIHWRTTARTSSLMVRETEAEDLHRVTLALPTCCPQSGETVSSLSPEMEEAFERAVELTTSLAWYFQKRGFGIRALVGEQEIREGTGEAHLYRLFRVLGLCRPTISKDGSIPDGFRNLGNGTTGGDHTILVLPWKDSLLEDLCRGAGSIYRVWELKEPVHES